MNKWGYSEHWPKYCVILMGLFWTAVPFEIEGWNFPEKWITYIFLQQQSQNIGKTRFENQNFGGAILNAWHFSCYRIQFGLHSARYHYCAYIQDLFLIIKQLKVLLVSMFKIAPPNFRVGLFWTVIVPHIAPNTLTQLSQIARHMMIKRFNATIYMK